MCIPIHFKCHCPRKKKIIKFRDHSNIEFFILDKTTTTIHLLYINIFISFIVSLRTGSRYIKMNSIHISTRNSKVTRLQRSRNRMNFETELVNI